MPIQRRRFMAYGASGVTALVAGQRTALADSPPQPPGRPLNLLVPWPVGGPVDGNARLIQPELSRLANAPIVIDNVPGAGGVIGLNRYTQRPAADRGLIMINNSDVLASLLATPNQKIRPEDFLPVALTALGGSVLVVREGLQAQTFDELVRLARRQASATLKFGHFGSGSYYQLLWDELSQRTATAYLEVPYKGAADILRDLGTGDLDVALLPLNRAVVSYPRTRSIGITMAARNPYFPDLPTLSQSVEAPGFASMGWFAIATWKGTPGAEVDRLRMWVQGAVAGDAASNAYRAQGSVPPPAWSRAEIESFYTSETERYRAQLRRLGLLAPTA